MTSISWEIGYEPRWQVPFRLMDHSYPKVDFWNISSDILETHDIRPFYVTLNVIDIEHDELVLCSTMRSGGLGGGERW